MNLMNQRRVLADAYEAGAFTKTMLEQSLRFPVFIFNDNRSDFTDQEFKWLVDNVMETHRSGTATGKVFLMPKVVPYECFRVVSSDFFDQWWISDVGTICFRCCDTYKDEQQRPGYPKVKMTWTTHFVQRKSAQLNAVRIWINGQGGREQLDPATEQHRKIAEAPNSMLAYFLFDVMSGTSTVVKVTDDQPGRSVQWRLNREHYLVLNHKQAQSLQQRKRGVSDQELVRGAHWRRAHLRRLMSDKFKKKKGLLVPVRKAWVGPIEWKGHDGKIYKVTEIQNNQL